MKALKTILIVLLVVVVIAAVGIYFLPNHYTVTKTVEINTPASVVYSQVSDYTKWAAWSPWAEMEPTAKNTYEGTPGQPGHKMTWEGEKLGQGAETMVSAVPNQSIDNDLEFFKPFKATAKDHWKFEEANGKTKVTWSSEGPLDYPMGRLFGLKVDEMMGEQQQHGLDKLKAVCESMPAPEPVASTDSTTTTPM